VTAPLNRPKIIATIGPASNKPHILERLADRGVSFFRINLSHTDEGDIEQRIKDVIGWGVPMILDTEGSQIRSGNREEIALQEGSEIRVYNKQIRCDNQRIWLNPGASVNALAENDLIFIDFNSVILKVTDTSKIERGYVECVVLIGGNIGGRKAVYVDSLTFALPAFSQKDRKAVALAKKHGIRHFTLSFMESPAIVLAFRKHYPTAMVYSKIESQRGLKYFEEIAQVSDGLLIDRGDLSHQVPLERLPFTQKHILSKCRELSKEAFVATNTLELMASSLKPNRAEVNDIINTLLDGATGIALTRETAVGRYPVETVNMLNTLFEQVQFVGDATRHSNVIEHIRHSGYIHSTGAPQLLISPHGGVLINRYDPAFDPGAIAKKIKVSREILMDAEQIAVGAFSPLEGFLCEKDLRSMAKRMRLENGTVWTIPVILQVPEADRRHLNIGDHVGLVSDEDNKTYAVLQVEDIYKIDPAEFAIDIFGTADNRHPGVKAFLERGGVVLGGKITLIKKLGSAHSTYDLTPAQTRRVFTERGWSKVIAFHTRNVIHRSHEFIQLEGLRRSLCDGLFVHPIIGRKKPGDFEASAVVATYEAMMNNIYPRDKVVLCTWSSYSRYAGPREAIFTALVRKNFGCSHFIVGRDHTGVGDFYPPNASHQIFDAFSGAELGVTAVKFDRVFYSKSLKKHLHAPDSPDHADKDKHHISGTEARLMLKKGKYPPEWFMRKEIAKVILEAVKSGKKVFVE
jgi:pyruvate kinase